MQTKSKDQVLKEHVVQLQQENTQLQSDNTQYKNLISEQIEYFKQLHRRITGFDIQSDSPNEIAANVCKYFENIIALMPGHVYWVDKNDIHLGCNDEMARSAGLSSRFEIIGKTNATLPWKASAEKLHQINQGILETGQSLTIEETGVMATGEEKVFLTKKSPLRNQNGDPIGVLGISIDITDRKQKEQELQEAKEAAEAASEAKTHFLENMRHDIRTPLTGIVGFAELIKGEAKDATISQYADNLTASGRALLDFLNEILDTIKVASGEVPVLKKPFDLKSKFLDIMKLNQAKAQTKHLDFAFSYDDHIAPCLLGDPVRLQRIILELVTNALNFTTKGHVRVSVSLAESPYPDQMIKLVVSDSGIGIPKDQQEELYVRFNRLSPAYEGIYKGRGLGLSIVKQFMDDLKGEIRVESEPNKGTTFTCLIPLQVSLFTACKEELKTESLKPIPLSEKKKTVAKTALAKVSHPKTKVTKVLLVEDDHLAQQVTKSLFTSLNCEVEIASDGQSAIKAFKANGYELIIMDIGLPDMDGYQVTKSLRLIEGKKEPQVPIIALSAHTDMEYKKTCIEAGMNAVFNKPLLRDQAVDLLQTFVPDRHQQAAEAKKTAARTLPAKQQKDLLKISGKVMDLTYLITQFGKDSKTIPELIKLFLKSLPEDLASLKQAYQKHDLKQLKALAHKIKGASLYCGAARLAEVCKRIETQTTEEDQALVSKLYEMFLKEAEAYQKEAKKKVK